MATGFYDITDVIFCFGNWHGPRFKCGHLKNDEVYKQLTELESIVPPCGGCMQYYCHFILSCNPRKTHGEMKPQRTLYIVNKNPLYMGCPCGATRPTGQYNNSIDICAQQCFRNIESGKCVDPYMINIIGRRFFAKKYELTLGK